VVQSDSKIDEDLERRERVGEREREKRRCVGGRNLLGF